MFAAQLLRVSVHERISAAAEDFLLQAEEGEEAARVPALRALLTERLTAAAEEIVDVQQLSSIKEEFPPQQQQWGPSVKQQEEQEPPHIKEKQEEPEPPHIKEEQEELWSSQEGEQLQGLGEAEVTKFTVTSVTVKSEEDEEKPQSSQLLQSLIEENREDCEGPEPGGLTCITVKKPFNCYECGKMFRSHRTVLEQWACFVVTYE
ncbi:hypothetical protein F2P81_024811 [Scophthalmus maximus]|uniref:Uncharacterized protein n=1 Tax=Scophthalmus maximus TaxID=52904 RepID=A0A6A4RTW8_SCOMX|nr:hypothetical protein F2P81_024811 [Scophthalmus maximus]